MRSWAIYPAGCLIRMEVQRIRNASNELTLARAAMMKAHIEFGEFLGRGVGSQDLDNIK